MSESKSELVSSLVDNYQQNDELFDELFDQLSDDKFTNGDLSDIWSSYHLIGDVIRDEVPVSIQLDLSAQIAAVIMDEPTILAPSSSNGVVSTFKARIIQFSKPFGQIAIAASAAGLMILSVQQNGTSNEIIMPNQVVQTIPFAGIADPVSFNYQSTNKVSAKESYIIQQRRFQALLSDHNQQIKLNASVVTNIINQDDLLFEKVEDLPK